MIEFGAKNYVGSKNRKRGGVHDVLLALVVALALEVLRDRNAPIERRARNRQILNGEKLKRMLIWRNSRRKTEIKERY